MLTAADRPDGLAGGGAGDRGHPGLHAPRLRNRIAALPDGEYIFERAMDDDGFPVSRIPLVCTARIKGETLELDFAKSGPRRGARSTCPTAR
jgi:N-methylhydantoinase B/oxoprolinase/acetone carboxylase alpha subunit